MADPKPSFYIAPKGRVCAGGRLVHPHFVLDLLAAAPEGGWVQANTNRFADCWAPSGLRTTIAPSSMFRAWSCFGWDSTQHGFWMWGGGHANYSGNEVYFWSALDGQWRRAFLGSRWRTFPSTVYEDTRAYEDIDPTKNTPVSAHCYDNNIYLPILDRFLTFCGAAQGDGAIATIYDDQGNRTDFA